MSELEKLIAKLSPNGVEYKSLSHLIIVEKGKQLNKTLLSDIGEYPVINGGITPSGYWHEYNYKENLITISQGGASAGFINYITTKFWAGAHCYVIAKVNKEVNYRYLYHFLKSKEVVLQNSQVGAGIPSVSLSDINDLCIPLPPLEVQNEIVRILDKLTELTARRKQYEYYRKNLLTFTDDTTFINLEDLFTTKNGYTPSKSNKEYWENGNVSWYRMEDIRENGKILSNAMQHVTMKGIKGKLFPKNSIIISTSATIGEHALITEDFICNQRFTCLMIKEQYKNNFDTKFLFYYCYLLSEWCINNLNQGNFASVDMKLFGKFRFPMIGIQQQQRIVDILDRFDKLCNDIWDGLPAEIEARKKQYEYYRDKLLNFKKLECDN